MACNDTYQSMCGDPVAPENPDLGQCFPYRVRQNCERPDAPTFECDDDQVSAIYEPDSTPRFAIVTSLFDENCDPILDENNARIMTRS